MNKSVRWARKRREKRQDAAHLLFRRGCIESKRIQSLTVAQQLRDGPMDDAFFRPSLGVMNTMLSPQLRELYYLGALESPGSWLIRAIQLKSAAERLDWMRFPAREEERGFDHFHEYSMLLGMSFEALIKGHISRARILSKIDPVLMREHFTHDLRSLAQCPECAHLSFTVPELEELAWLSQFIEWAGRYPMPRKAGAMEVGFGTTDSQYHLQKDLWDRVHASLRADAWVMKSGPENLGGLKKQVGQPAT